VSESLIVSSPHGALSAQGFNDVSALRKAFAAHGPIRDVNLQRNKQTGFARGFAFVTYQQSYYADLCVA
jgi:RNA recognition motif-containing protein